MRTAILAGGLRSSAPAFVCFAEDGELAVTFFSLATGLLGQTALGAKKNARKSMPVEWDNMHKEFTDSFG